VTQADTPHLVSGFGGSGRFELWRVAVAIFADHPIVGAGVDNYAVDFLRERQIEDNPRYPHSLELRLLQQTGLVGTALFALFVVAAVAAGWGTLRRGPPATRGVAVTALLVFAYWLVHGSADWLWEIPALSAIALSALGLWVALSPVSIRPGHRLVVPVAAVTLGAVALLTLLPAWMSAREIEQALASWRVAPESAYTRLDRARRFDPFSDQPDVLGAVIAAQRGDVARQRQLLLRALDRNPSNWYPHLELGLIAARRGDQVQALRRLDRAANLNPLDRLIRFARVRVRAGMPPTQAEIDEFAIRSADLLTGVQQG
jgi:hypothetical protein